MSAEFAYWQAILRDLNTVMTIAEITKNLGMDDDRMVWRWKAGKAKPTGRKAVRLYLLHAKYCQISHVHD